MYREVPYSFPSERSFLERYGKTLGMAATGLALVSTVVVMVHSRDGATEKAPVQTASLDVTNLNSNFMPPVPVAGTCPTTTDGLVGKYSQIFPSGNRNAASFKWFSYIFACAGNLDAATFEELGTGFCPISGSPIDGRSTGRVELPKVSGGSATGIFHFCCTPCICDIEDIVRVDTKTVQFKSQSKQYNVLVHGDPCKHENLLKAPFTDPFSQTVTTLAAAAPEVQCDTAGHLQGATFSDNGYPIIGLLYPDSSSPAVSIDGTTAASKADCKARAAAGFNSGMGLIFQKVAGATPVSVL